MVRLFRWLHNLYVKATFKRVRRSPVDVYHNHRPEGCSERLWSVVVQNAHLRLKEAGYDTPVRSYPYAGVSRHRQPEQQAYWNWLACTAIVLLGGTWEDSKDQGF